MKKQCENRKKKYKSIYGKDESKMLRDKIYKTATAEQTQKKCQQPQRASVRVWQ